MKNVLFKCIYTKVFKSPMPFDKHRMLGLKGVHALIRLLRLFQNICV